MKALFTLLIILSSLHISADCVYSGAKDKDEYKIIDTGYGAKIYFMGGYSSDFIIELDGSLYSSYIDEMYFIKDDFCDWEDDVLVIDGEVFGVKSVNIID